MEILAQYNNQQLGEFLKLECLKDYTNMIIVSAFAKTSGVLRLKPILQQFKENGGVISSYIGCDANGTSYEALLNLFRLSDELIVVHDENPYITFHPKFYILHNNNKAWCFVGSNNLTGGGMWTNIEFGTIFELDFLNNHDSQIMNQINKFISSFSQNGTALNISSTEILDDLLKNKYVLNEINLKLKISSIRGQDNIASVSKKLFSSSKLTIPTLLNKFNNTTQSKEHDYEIKNNQIDYSPETNEHFWFEFRKGTGGSRNILDLSMTGKICSGDAKETKYYNPETPTFMLGGVAFFDIMDPSDHTFKKNITINYNGVDYYPATILISNGGANDNGSWRIQLKGSSNNNISLASFGVTEFVNNILLFQKVNSNYFILTTLPNSLLDELKSKSKVCASNGSAKNSKLFGLLQ